MYKQTQTVKAHYEYGGLSSDFNARHARTVKEKSLNASWMFYGDNSLNIAPDLKSQIYQVAKNLPQPKKEVKVEKTEKEVKLR